MFSHQIKVNIEMAWHHVIGHRRERALSAKDLRRFGSEKCRRKVKQLGRGVGMALVAAGGVLAGIFYVARKKIASVATVVYRGGKRLFGRALTTLAGMMLAFAFGGT
jgi:hypothetical protein